MTTRTALALCLAVTAFSTPAAGQEGPLFRDSPTVQASCVIRIDFDPATLPLSTNLVYALVRSAPLAAQAARETSCEGLDYGFDLELLAGPEAAASGRYYTMRRPPARVPSAAPRRMPPRREPTGVSRREVPGAVSYAAVPAAPGTFIANLSVLASRDKGATKAKLEKLLAAVCDRLEKALVDSTAASKKRMESRLADLMDRCNDAERRLDSLSVHKSSFAKAVQLLRQQNALERELASNEVKNQATREQVAHLAAQAAEKLKDDAVAAELAKIVKVREQQVQLVRRAHEQEQATPAEIGEAEAELAEARVELARRREQVGEAAGGDLLKELNRQLIEMSIRAHQLQAELQPVMKRLKEIRAMGLSADAARFDRLGREVELARKECDRLAESKLAVRMQFRELREPVLTVIGGKPAAAKTQPTRPARSR